MENLSITPVFGLSDCLEAGGSAKIAPENSRPRRTLRLAALVSMGMGLLAAIGSPAAADPLHTRDTSAWANFKFVHPGLTNSLDELNLIKSKIAQNEEPWAAQYKTLSQYARTTYKATPYANVYQGLNGIADHGFNQEMADANEAYGLALMWIFTGNQAYAAASAAILDAWSSTLQSQTGDNWYLEAAWAGSLWPLSAELLRATYPAWTGSVAFSQMLNNIFLPPLHNRMAFGNRELATINAMMAIGVYNNDVGAFVEAVNHYESYVPSYFYVTTDGKTPIATNYWTTTPSDTELKQLDAHSLPKGWTSWIVLAAQNYSPAAMKQQGLYDDTTELTQALANNNPAILWGSNVGVYLNGYSPETGGRDLAHAEAAFGSAINMAEIAYHQNIDLYKPYVKRLTAFMETTASLRLGATPSPKSYGGTLQTGNGIDQSYEIAYDHFHNILNVALPNTETLITSALRQAVTPSYVPGSAQGRLWSYAQPIPALFAPVIWGQAAWISAWTTLTHGDLHAAN